MRKMASVINFRYDDQPYYRRALTSPSFCSAKRNKVLAVQEQVVDNLPNRSKNTWRQRWVSPRESEKCPKLGAHAPMVRDDKQLLLLDSCRNRINFPDEGLRAGLLMLDVLPQKQVVTFCGMKYCIPRMKKNYQAHESAWLCTRVHMSDWLQNWWPPE